MYDVIVIGGGASGLTVANVAKKRGKSVIVLEAGSRVGKKLLVAGNGKCNVSHENVVAENYHGSEFVAPFLQKNGKVYDFFKDIGLTVKSIGGRIYPYSESGNTVLNLLRRGLDEEIFVDTKAENIEFADGIFTVNGYRGKNVVVCTGGITAGGIASYGLLEKFGHKRTATEPVLSALRTETKDIKSLVGIRVKCDMTLTVDGKKAVTRKGELLFKDNGLSGIVSMELSRYLSTGSENTVHIDFVPEYSAEEIAALDKEGLLHKAVYAAALKQADERKTPVEEVLKDFTVGSVKLGDKATAQVTRGGIDVGDFDENLCSKLQKGLYACGEVLDVDGDCGGYNLHWAFLSGIIAGESV